MYCIKQYLSVTTLITIYNIKSSEYRNDLELTELLLCSQIPIIHSLLGLYNIFLNLRMTVIIWPSWLKATVFLNFDELFLPRDAMQSAVMLQ